MNEFHVNIFACPTSRIERAPVSLRDEQLEKLVTAGGAPLLFDAPLEVTWERVAEQLEALPRMIFEPDGSFVWSGEAAGERWQVDGHLFEQNFASGPRLHRLELHGQCPHAQLEQLLDTVRWPHAKLVFELVVEGVALDDENFRRWAVAPS